MNEFLRLMKKRRSRYALAKQIPLSREALVRLVKETVRMAPSAFNSQGTRVLILFGVSHEQLWDLTLQSLRRIIPAAQLGSTEQKLIAFKAAYGTVLFFEEENTIRQLQQQFTQYKENFPLWAAQSNAMLEFAVWCVFAQEGIGASLQHYNPIIDEEVRRAFNVPESWKLMAQMPFGTPVAPPALKTELPVEERVKVFE